MLFVQFFPSNSELVVVFQLQIKFKNSKIGHPIFVLAYGEFLVILNVLTTGVPKVGSAQGILSIKISLVYTLSDKFKQRSIKAISYKRNEFRVVK